MYTYTVILGFVLSTNEIYGLHDIGVESPDTSLRKQDGPIRTKIGLACRLHYPQGMMTCDFKHKRDQHQNHDQHQDHDGPAEHAG